MSSQTSGPLTRGAVAAGFMGSLQKGTGEERGRDPCQGDCFIIKCLNQTPPPRASIHGREDAKPGRKMMPSLLRKSVGCAALALLCGASLLAAAGTAQAEVSFKGKSIEVI